MKKQLLCLIFPMMKSEEIPKPRDLNPLSLIRRDSWVSYSFRKQVDVSLFCDEDGVFIEDSSLSGEVEAGLDCDQHPRLKEDVPIWAIEFDPRGFAHFETNPMPARIDRILIETSIRN